MSAPSYSLLVAAGAPVLPEGLSYRIRESSGPFTDRFEVALVRWVPSWWTGGRRAVVLGEVTRHKFFHVFTDGVTEPVTDPLAHVANACRDVVEQHEEDLSRAGQAEQYRRLFGTHP